ncbi:MAG: DUF4253 domain-containing protein [Fimbriiglobus sp.]
MEVTTRKVSGNDAIRILNVGRERYPTTRQYPFLIGDIREMEQLNETAEFHEDEPSEIVQASLEITVPEWIASRQRQVEGYGFDPNGSLGEWPEEEEIGKGSIGLHKDVLTGEVRPEVCLGLVTIDKPWHLPAFVKYGGWNDCPSPEVHCAFFRHWQEKYGAEITGMSGDIIECVVRKPPMDQSAAIELAWEQYWYCADIVEQGCGSVSNLAATLLDSPYWYFWWD